MYEVNIQVTADGDARASSRPSSSEPVPDADAHARAVPFSAGNPSVEHVTGIVHLYRRVPGRGGEGEGDEGADDDAGAATQLALLALPDDLGVSDLCDLLGGHLAGVRGIRLVRRMPHQAAAEASADTTAPPPPTGARLALLRFDAPATMAACRADLDGRPFSSLDPRALVRAVPVRAVALDARAPAPPAGATELPPCPVCLERLDDDVSGVVTTVCNHDFHAACLGAWGSAACPVCRYTASGAPPPPPCEACGATADLWLCLICGHVGCGRYAAAHAADHARASAHNYALETASGAVWDYAADGYVHRLVRSAAAAGKLVEVPRPETAAGSSRGGAAASCAADVADPATVVALAESKADAVAAQYSTLLTHQLDAQRVHYETAIASARSEADAASADAASARVAAAASDAAAAAAASEAARSADKARSAEQKAAAGAAAGREVADLRALADGLARAAAELRRTLASERAARAAQVADLEEQVRDLAFALDAGATLARGGASEAVGGTMLPVPPPPASTPKRRGGKR